MPGVADAERRTKAVQEQRSRKQGREDLLRLIAEGRLHEADSHQLETIKLALELNGLINDKQDIPQGIDPSVLTEALRGAVAAVVAGMPTASGPTNSHASDPARPQMKHTALTSISHKDSGLDISHGDALAEESAGDDDAGDKLRRLKEIRGAPDGRPKD